MDLRVQGLLGRMCLTESKQNSGSLSTVASISPQACGQLAGAGHFLVSSGRTRGATVEESAENGVGLSTAQGFLEKGERDLGR